MAPGTVKLLLCGDVMTGRGIDQALPHPSDPRIFESYAHSALEYVKLAEQAQGPIPRPVDFRYVWGDALEVLDRLRPDARIVNLETAVTTSGDAWPGKGIHYRMHPANVPCLTAARVDCCVLANNHVLDWGRGGLEETLRVLHEAGIRTAGAGRDADDAAAPAAIPLPGGARVLVFAFATPSSGVAPEWAAGAHRPGVSFLADLAPSRVDAVARAVGLHRMPGDIVVASIHWGGNWGYAIGADERAFAHALVETAGVDVVHGHSSHHPKAMEVHAGRPILYGCGDFLNDYEGISGYQEFEPDLCAMYLPEFDASTGRLARLEIVPMRIRHFRVERAPAAAARWLAGTLDRESRKLGTRVESQPGGGMRLAWKERVS